MLRLALARARRAARSAAALLGTVAPAAALSAVVLAAAAARPSDAGAQQYFGRNKVNYERYDFQTLKTPHFDVLYYPSEAVAAADAARMAERWYARLSPFMRHTLPRRSIVLFADQPDFQQNNITDIESEGTGGVTESFRSRVVMPFTGIYNDTHHVLGHELVHVFQYDIANNTPGAQQGLATLPLWLIEGMAEYLSLGRADVNTATWLRDAARRNDVPSIKKLTNDPRYFPYRYGQALWAYVGGRYGDQAVVDVYRNALRVGFEQAIRRTLDVSTDQLSKDWADAIKGAYLPLIAGRQVPDSVGTNVVLQKNKRGSEYNIGPSISPDGRTVAFFSSRGLFGVDLYIADAETGRIVRQLGSINSPRHFDALSFINTSGSWSPDGRQFAHVVYAGGNQILALYDVAAGRDVRELKTPGIGAALDPAWSPDGRTIAFTGQKGGITDLYAYDLGADAVTQLTNDRLAQLQPAWSPDGRTLAFTTDQGPGTDLDSLTFAPTRIGTLDVATRRVTVLPGFPGARHINPQWAPDGRSVYFIADPDGFSDVYRQDLATAQRFRLTRTATGVAGITNLSPALTVARQTGRVLFSVFDRQGYDLVRLDGARALGTPVEGANTGTAVAEGPPAGAPALGGGVGGTGPGSVPGTTPTTAASSSSGNSGGEGGVLPPAGNVRASVIEGYLADAGTGLTRADTAYVSSRLSSRIGLNYVAPPTIGAGYNSYFGAGVQGGIAALFGDQLNNQQIVAVVQAQGQVQDIGGQAQYINTSRRLNYGAGIGHIPYPIGYVNLTRNQDGTYNYAQNIVRITVDQAFGLTQYPLNATQRFEFTGGFTRQSVSGTSYVTVLNSAGQAVDQFKRKIRAGDIGAAGANNSAQVSAAFVGDYSVFGLTSPIAGGRYRFEVTPNFIDQRFAQVTADYRRYFFFRPVTFAVRGLHLGRYGGNADSLSDINTYQNFSAVQPLYVGFPTLVRGYDVYSGSFRSNECGTTTAAQNVCPAFNRLFGSRVAVLNAEFRIPVLAPAGLGIIPTNILPVDIVPFVDAGLAWTGNESPKLRFAHGDDARNTLDRIPVVSAGVSARINLLGFAVIEAFYAHPFQRPDRPWVLGFQLAPGW